MRSDRRLSSWFVSLLVLGLVAAGCGSSGPVESPFGPGAPEGRGATIQGTVLPAGPASSHSSAQALSSGGGIRITVVGTSLSTTTDSSGRFTLVGVPPGTVTLRFQGPGIDARIEISGLSEGSTITITVEVSGSKATIITKSGDDDDEDDEVEFEGRIESITPPTLRVAGRTVVTDPSTKFSGEGKVKSLADLKVGMRVEVEGTAQADGSVLARKIKVEDDEDDDGDDEDDDDDDS